MIFLPISIILSAIIDKKNYIMKKMIKESKDNNKKGGKE